MEYQDFPSKTFCLTVTRNFVGKHFSVSLLSGAEKDWIREGLGSMKIFFRNFSSHSAEDFCRETLYCFTTFGCRKSFDKRGGGDYQDFLSKIFFLTVPKKFLRESIRVSLISGMEKFFASAGHVTIFDFLSKFFCLTVTKNFVGEPFCAVFQKNSGSEKVNG